MSNSYWNRFSQQRVSRRRALAVSGGTVLGASFLAACGGDDGDDGGSDSAQATGSGNGDTPQRGGRLGEHCNVSSPNFNVLTNHAEGSRLAGTHVYDRLMSVRVDEREYVLEAAAGVELAEPTRVIVKLKPGMVYQNKAPVNGRAVKASDIVKLQEKVLATPDANQDFVLESLDNVEAPDDETLVFTLKAPNAWLFSQAGLASYNSMALIPEELLDDLDTAEPIGSGPYELAEYNLGSRYLFRRFDNYRQAAEGLPYIDEREVFVLEDSVTQESAFRAGRIHIWEPATGSVDALVSDLGDSIQVFPYHALAIMPWMANGDNAPWNDERVRQAMYRATNREQIRDLIYGGKAQLATGTISQGHSAYVLEDASQTEEFFRFDPAEARSLLEAASYPFDEEFSIINGQGSADDQQNEVWARQLTEAGMTVRSTPLTFSEFIDSIPTMELFINQWGNADTPQGALRFQHSNPLSYAPACGPRDPALDALIERSETTLDLEERASLIREIQLEALRQYTGCCNILTPEFTILVKREVQDYELHPAEQTLYQTGLWLRA